MGPLYCTCTVLISVLYMYSGTVLYMWLTGTLPEHVHCVTLLPPWALDCVWPLDIVTVGNTPWTCARAVRDHWTWCLGGRGSGHRDYETTLGCCLVIRVRVSSSSKPTMWHCTALHCRVQSDTHRLIRLRDYCEFYYCQSHTVLSELSIFPWENVFVQSVLQ